MQLSALQALVPRTLPTRVFPSCTSRPRVPESGGVPEHEAEGAARHPRSTAPAGFLHSIDCCPGAPLRASVSVGLSLTPVFCPLMGRGQGGEGRAPCRRWGFSGRQGVASHGLKGSPPSPAKAQGRTLSSSRHRGCERGVRGGDDTHRVEGSSMRRGARTGCTGAGASRKGLSPS